MAPLDNIELKRGLGAIAAGKPDLMLEYFGRLTESDFVSALAEFIKRDPSLQGLSHDEKSRLFLVWSQRGNPDELVREIGAHPEWEAFAWQPLASYHGGKKNYRAAVDLFRRFNKAPALPEPATAPLEELQQAAYGSARNYEAGYALYCEQVRRQQPDDALITLRRFTEQAGAPSYFHFLEAGAWAASQNWEKAWQAWQKFLPAASRKSG